MSTIELRNSTKDKLKEKQDSLICEQKGLEDNEFDIRFSIGVKQEDLAKDKSNATVLLTEIKDFKDELRETENKKILKQIEINLVQTKCNKIVISAVQQSQVLS